MSHSETGMHFDNSLQDSVVVQVFVLMKLILYSTTHFYLSIIPYPEVLVFSSLKKKLNPVPLEYSFEPHFLLIGYLPTRISIEFEKLQSSWKQFQMHLIVTSNKNNYSF